MLRTILFFLFVFTSGLSVAQSPQEIRGKCIAAISQKLSDEEKRKEEEECYHKSIGRVGGPSVAQMPLFQDRRVGSKKLILACRLISDATTRLKVEPNRTLAEGMTIAVSVAWGSAVVIAPKNDDTCDTWTVRASRELVVDPEIRK